MPDSWPRRKQTRVPGFDYASGGAYFVTICTFNRGRILGTVADSAIRLSDAGTIVAEEWLNLRETFPSVTLDEHVVMPNHLHGIITISTDASERQTLGTIVRKFKNASTHRVRRACSDREMQLWQRNYYDHVVRCENDLNRIRSYIALNARHWNEDEHNVS